MSQAQFLAEVDNWIILASFWTSVSFPFVLGLFWKWWKTSFGRSLMGIEVLIGLALFPAAFHRMFGIDVTSIAYQWFVTIDIGLIPVFTTWRAWVLIKAQTKGRRIKDCFIWKLEPEGDHAPQHVEGA